MKHYFVFVRWQQEYAKASELTGDALAWETFGDETTATLYPTHEAAEKAVADYGQEFYSSPDSVETAIVEIELPD